MTREENIEALLKKSGVISTMMKYRTVKDLCIILSIRLKEKKFHDIEYVFKELPQTGEYDKIIVDTLESSSSVLPDYSVYEIVRTIVNDDIKLEAMEKYIARFKKHYVPSIINSLQSDEIRQQKFRENLNCYNDNDFSDYLGLIKDDDIRLNEFLLFHDLFPKYKLSMFAGSFKEEEKRIEIFDKYFYESNIDSIYAFKSYLSEENKIKLLDKYINLIKGNDISSFFTSISDEERLLYIYRKYKDIITSSSLYSLIRNFSNEKLRIKLLDESYMLLLPEDIMNIIDRLSTDELKIKIFDKYENLFGYEEYKAMLILISKSKCSEFFNSHADYFPGELFSEIWSNIHYYSDIGIDEDEILRRYIDRIPPKGFSTIIRGLYRKHTSNDSILRYLCSFTDDRRTIRNIYNGFAFEDRAYFIGKLFHSEYFTDAERRICERLDNNNLVFYEYFVFELLDIPTLKNNRYFLSKLAKYSETSQKIVDLYHKKPDLINLLLLIIKKVYDYDIYHDEMINSIIEAFDNRKNSFLEKIEIGKLTKERKTVLLYKLLNIDNVEFKSIDVDVNSVEDLDTYVERQNKKIDELYSTSDGVYVKKNLLFNKVFGITTEYAKKILYRYGFSLDKVIDNPAMKNIKLIRDIVNEDDINKIEEYYNNLPVLSLEERNLLEYEAKKIFNKCTLDSLYKIDEDTPIEYYIYRSVPVYKPKGDFFLLINSTVAYFSHDEITDYRKFLNKNDNIQNHGICCSLISNQNICQTAPINDIIFGFTDFSEAAIPLADSTDIYSHNESFCITTNHDCRFMTPQDCVDETRYNHNEYVIERNDLRKDKRRVQVKPSYVVVYDYFSKERQDKSILAASQLKIPIVYLDTKEIAERESKIIARYSRLARRELDTDVFKILVTRFFNNAHGFFEEQSDLANKYFNSLKLNIYVTGMLLSIETEYFNNLIELEKAIRLYDNVLRIILNEQDKCKKTGRTVIELMPIIENIRLHMNNVCEADENKTKA